MASAATTPLERKKPERTVLASILLLLVLSGIGALVIRETTRFGSGLRDDSFVYMSSAEGIETLTGYGRWRSIGSFKPTTSFPPFYPFTLAVVQWIGLDVHAGVRLLGGAGFGLTILLVGLGVLYTTRSGVFALLSAGLVLTSSAFIDVFSWALSESLFIPLSMASVVGLVMALRSGKRQHLWIVSVTSGLALLTRYAGVALVAALGLIILLDRSVERKQRFQALGLHTVLSLFPIGIFLARNLTLTGNLANRPMPRWYAPDLALVQSAGNIVISWFIPAFDVEIPNWLLGFVPLLLTLALGLTLRFAWLQIETGQRSSEDRSVAWTILVAGSYALIYMALLVISISVVDVNIQTGFSAVGERLLLPVYASVLLILALLLFTAWRRGTRVRQMAVLGIALAFLGVQVAAGLREFESLRSEGRGYNSGIWRNSRSLEYVRGLPEVPIFTNDLGAVYLLTDRYAAFIPTKFNPSTRQPRTDYAANLGQMRQILRREGGVILILGSRPWGRLDQDHLEDLIDGLLLVAEFRDGLIFQYEPNPIQ